jgi:hypothetical protein
MDSFELLLDLDEKFSAFHGRAVTVQESYEAIASAEAVKADASPSK